MEVVVVILAILALLVVLGFIFVFVGIYFFGDRIILRWYRAKEVKETKLNEALHKLAKSANIAMPKLYTIESEMPNIFSICRKSENASIVVTTKAMDLLDQKELECVFAHEIFHVKNRDTVSSTIVATLAGMLTASATLALWGAVFLGFGQDNDPAPKLIRSFAMSLSAPHAALLIQLTMPRSREYAADEYSARLCMKPKKLASALKKIDKLKLQVNPSHAHMFIVNPLSEEIFNSLFNTHPSIDERVKHLKRVDGL